MSERQGTVSTDATERYERLTDEPPSAKFVYKILEREGPLTRSEIEDETLLPSRTVTYAISRLRERSIVESNVSPRNPQKHRYRLLPVERR